MDLIKRIINLRDFREKFGKYEPSLDGESGDDTTYGKIINNIKVKKNDLYVRDDFPVLFLSNVGLRKYKEEIDGDIYEGIKYGTFALYYSWIKNFVMSSKYYILKKRKNEDVWSEIGEGLEYREEDYGKLDLFCISVSVFHELPEDTSAYVCGETIICVNEDEQTFYDMFFNQDYAAEFIEFSESKILTGKYDYLPPFAEIHVLVEEEVSDIGYYKKYVPDDINLIRIVDPTAFLVYGESYKIGDYAYFRNVKNINVNPSVYISDGVYVCVSPANIYQRFSLETHWKSIDIEINRDTEKEYFAESKLRTLERQKNSVDDYGEELDFVFNTSTLRCELKYVTGTPYNSVYNEKISAYTYDVISSISVDGIPIQRWDVSYMDEGDTGEIEFKYIVGNLLLPGDIDNIIATDSSGGGIEYTETYTYTIHKLTFTINGSTYENKPYVSIDYESGEKPENAEDGKQYAKIKISTTDEYVISGDIAIRNDNTIGVQDINYTSDDVNIDRGASSSYEAFNVIGEVNTIEDIEKYHNDWFRIGGKND